jgi:hypothetical protein
MMKYKKAALAYRSEVIGFPASLVSLSMIFMNVVILEIPRRGHED